MDGPIPPVQMRPYDKERIERLLIMLNVLLATASIVGSPCVTGHWLLEISGQPIFQIVIAANSKGTSAIWERPEHFESDGESFSRLGGPLIRRPANSVKRSGEDLELSFDDPRPKAFPDVFHVHCSSPDRLTITYHGIGMEPLEFVKSTTVNLRLGPWDSEKVYVPQFLRPTNREMTSIFSSDQADRQSSQIDWTRVTSADENRRVRTEELLRTGAIQSGLDYYHAAFIFQHGRASNDFLKAHLLAMIAMARGYPGALWIASATLDRYLQNIGKAQVLGTQYKVPNGAAATQEPYDRALVSDAMRKALHIPSISEQNEQQQKYTDESLETKKP